MNKIYPALFLLLSNNISLKSQSLYGVSFNGGDNGTGTISKLIPATRSLAVNKSFEPFTSNPLRANVVQASDGKLYGATSGGGRKGGGVIFSFDPVSSTYNDVKDLDVVNGVPLGGLVQANNGKLYGVTIGGGSSQSGIIFSFDPISFAYAVVREFDSVSGATPSGSLMKAIDGKLYGLTTYGGSGYHGSGGAGVLFSFDPTTSSYTELHEFDFASGSNPFGSLMQASDGKLYGTTLQGGNSNVGVIFSFDPVSISYDKLFDFDFTTGSNPAGSLVQGNDKKLYGVTTELSTGNYGVIFSFNPSSATYSKLVDFDSDKGTNPYGGLTKSQDGKLYGVTTFGGSSNGGVVFSFDPLTQSYMKLKDLDTITGVSPL